MTVSAALSGFHTYFQQLFSNHVTLAMLSEDKPLLLTEINKISRSVH